jgi:hypothetical protein
MRRSRDTVQEKHGWQGWLAGFADEQVEPAGRNRSVANVAGADRHGGASPWVREPAEIVRGLQIL